MQRNQYGDFEVIWGEEKDDLLGGTIRERVNRRRENAKTKTKDYQLSRERNGAKTY
jgi:hypothetical protein